MKFNYLLTSLAANAFFALAQSKSTRITTITTGKIEAVATLSPDVSDVKLDCFNVLPQEIEKHKKMNEICEEEQDSTEKSCYQKVKSSDASSYKIVKFQTGKSCMFYTTKAGSVTTDVPTTTTTTTKIVPSVHVTTITTGRIEAVATLSPDVTDVKLDCFNVLPQEIEKHKKMNEICEEEQDSTEKSCYEKVQSSDASSYKIVKFQTGKSCMFYTTKAGSVTTDVPTTTTTTTKIVPSVHVTTITTGRIEAVATLSPDVADVKLDCFNVLPQEIEKHKKMNEICEEEQDSSEKSCYEKVKSSDASSYKIVKFQTGKSCMFYTTKTGSVSTTTKTVSMKKSYESSKVFTKCSAKWAQCGGVGFNGPTCCESGTTCRKMNKYYSYCF